MINSSSAFRPKLFRDSRIRSPFPRIEQDEHNKIENRFRGIAYENNLKINNNTIGEMRSGFQFVQLNHPTFVISVMRTK